ERVTPMLSKPTPWSDPNTSCRHTAEPVIADTWHRLDRQRSVRTRQETHDAVGQPAGAAVPALVLAQPGAWTVADGDPGVGAAVRRPGVRVRHRHPEHPVLLRLPGLVLPPAPLRRVGVHGSVRDARDPEVPGPATCPEITAAPRRVAGRHRAHRGGTARRQRT